MADRSVGRIVLGRDELNVLISEAEIVDCLLNQVRVLVAFFAIFVARNAHEKYSIADVAITSGFQPGIVGVPIDFLFQRIEDAHPRIRNDR